MTKIQKFVQELVEEQETSNPFTICRNLKIPITYIDSKEIKGSATVVMGKPHIVLSSYLEGFNKYFVLAHELCHILKHDVEQICFFKENTYYSTDKYEMEANEFAAFLLLDKDTLSYDVKEEEVDYEVGEELLRFIYKQSS